MTTPAQTPDVAPDGAPWLILLGLAIAAWVAFRWFMHRRNVQAAERVVGGSFEAFALEALANAARIDGRVVESERAALTELMREIAGPNFDPARAAAALDGARLNKDQLLDYLAKKSGTFSHEQKSLLLKSLLALIVADNKFHEAEHAALVDYTEAVGFDRQSAPDLLRSLGRDVKSGNMI
jgi:hypothetical protein